MFQNAFCDSKCRTNCCNAAEGCEWAPTEVVEVLGMPYALGDAASFASIPDAQWPSDHLALGAVLQLV